MKKTLPSLFFLLWTGILITTYYVVQKPNISALVGLADTLWTLLVAALLIFNAYGIGRRILQLIKFDSSKEIEHFLFSLGIGLGGLGLLGLGVSALQIANAPILGSMQVALAVIFILGKDGKNLRQDFQSLRKETNLTFSQYNTITKLAIILPITFSFLLTLVPPFEAFDALFYHLTQPARILQDGGLQLINIPHFWFPNITEHTYLWALAFRSERAAQIIHFAWGMLSGLLLWHWAVRTWNIEIGRKTALLLATIPSLPLLASWAYADMALTFYAIAALFALTQYKTTQSIQWLRITGILCGLAMGVKYTSFVVPLTCGLLLLLHRPFIKTIRTTAQFSLIAIITALPWYLRNAVLMGNPFYPFAFGGRYWDSFLAQWYSGAGTGIGWDAVQLIRLPLDAVLGYRDANFFDGRMGVIFLILFPATLWIIIKRPHQNLTQNWSLLSISLFSALSFIAWTLGVINSSALWQTRLLFPALLPFAIPTALGWHALTQLDTTKFRVSFLVNTLIGLAIALTIFENGISVLQRNPLAVAFGAQSREQYIQRINPPYAALIQVMEELPAEASVYSLFEPRSYDLPRITQPDAIVSNFAHDLYLYQTPDAIIQQWHEQQYTHILVYERGLQFMLDSNSNYQSISMKNPLTETLNKLQMVSQTPDDVYTIYKIP